MLPDSPLVVVESVNVSGGLREVLGGGTGAGPSAALASSLYKKKHSN